MRFLSLGWKLCPFVIAAGQACRPADIVGPSSPVASVGITLGFAGHVSHAFLTEGDQDTVRAQGYTGGWPSYTKYDSNSEPRRFTYSSSNPSVASVDPDGVVAALSPGTTILRASVEGIASLPLELAVVPPANALVAEPDSIAAFVGQTIAISIRAVDSNGQSVPGLIFNVGVDTTHWAVTSIPAEGTWKLKTPAVLHLNARVSGRVRVIATAPNERPQARLVASVPIAVRDP